MKVPAGAVSRNDEFWKRVDEQRVDAATYDLLLKNGLRVGIALNDDWDYFRDILEANHAEASVGTARAEGSGAVELSVKKGITVEDVFYLSDTNELKGRTYEQCENLLGVTFWSEPRHPEQTRVSVSPLVRSYRTRLEYSVLNEERRIREVRPEHLYDLNLRAIIPANSFMVISPSSQGEWPTSMGNQFFRTDGASERSEIVLVMVPRSGESNTGIARPTPRRPATVTAAK